jgi:hypothetical protein
MTATRDLPPLADRIARKRHILESWVKDGVPVEKLNGMPRSLRDARPWQDTELGLYAIGSPNDFTKTHPLWGDDVSNIEVSIAALRARYLVKKPKPAERPAAKSSHINFGLAELVKEKDMLVRQWNEARMEAADWMSRAGSAEGRLRRTKNALDEARREVARLKEQLDRRTHLRVVK